MWKNRFKIAVIQQDVDTIEKLVENIPKLESIDEMKELMYLLKEASLIFQELKNETALNIKSIEKNLSFLQSSEAIKNSKIDIKS